MGPGSACCFHTCVGVWQICCTPWHLNPESAVEEEPSSTVPEDTKRVSTTWRNELGQELVGGHGAILNLVVGLAYVGFSIPQVTHRLLICTQRKTYPPYVADYLTFLLQAAIL